MKKSEQFTEFQMEMFEKEYNAGNGSSAKGDLWKEEYCSSKIGPQKGFNKKQDVEWDDTDNGVERKVIKVLMGIPNEGHTLCESYDNRLEMAFHMGSLQVLSLLGETQYAGNEYEYPSETYYEFSLSSVGQTFPALARERIAEMAVDNGFDYLLMVDDDMLTPVDLFERLIRHKVDICAALAFTRQPPHYPVIYNLKKGYDEVERKRYYINTHVRTYPKDKLVKCDAVGFGAVLIKVDTLRKMKKPWFMSTSGAGEDIHFCHQAGEQGFSVYMDTSTKLGHLGYPKRVTEETYEMENKVREWREKGEENKYES